MDNLLRRLRTERGWTQEELGRQVAVSRQAIIAIENGRHDPSLDLAYRLAAQFGFPVEAVFPNPHSSSETFAGPAEDGDRSPGSALA